MITKKRIIIVISLILFLIFCFSTYNVLEKKIKKERINNTDIISVLKKEKNYKEENKNRYISYYYKNKDLSISNIIIYVNIGLDKDFYSYVKPADVRKDYLVLVNKYNKLDDNYVPLDLEEIDSKNFISNAKNNMLRKEACFWFQKLSNDSIKNDTPVFGQSAFRSYERQKELYNSYKNIDGEEKANLYSAKPGFSEHQTGLCIDVSSTKEGNMDSFEKTPSFKWMIDNAHKYGFILRYPLKKEKIHGYIYEPWHYRFVGVKIATLMHEKYSNLSYDEFYYKFID